MNRKKIFLYIISLSLLVLVLLFIMKYRVKITKIITPFIMATIISYFLNPFVKRLKNKKTSRSFNIIVVYALFILLVAATVVFLIPELVNNTRDLINSIPELTEKYQNIFTSFLSAIHSSNWSAEIKQTILDEIYNAITLIQNYIVDILRKSLSILIETASFFIDFLIALVISYYFLKDAEFFKNTLLYLIPHKWRKYTITLGKEVNLVLSNFIQGQLLIAIIIGFLESIGLRLIGVKYALVLGLIGGISNIIPYFGPILGAIPAAAAAFIDSPLKALWAILVFVIIQQLDNAIISPKIIQGKLGMHPVATIFAVLAGGEFFGIMGMIFAVPVFAILKVILKNTVDAIA